MDGNIKPTRLNIEDEDPIKVQEDLTYIKEWIKKQPYLNARTDDNWLLTFLRGSKYSLERTKHKLDTFYTTRTLMPEYFHNRDPTKQPLAKVVKEIYVIPIVDHDDQTAPMLLYMRQHYDPNKTSISDMFKLVFTAMDIAMCEHERTGYNGLSAIIDLELATLAHLTPITAGMVKKILMTVEKGYPLRIKQVHFINAPPIFETIMTLVKMFASEKLKSRLQIHKGQKSLLNVIPARLLPSEVGGEGPSRDELQENWYSLLEKYHDWILEDAKYGTIEKLRPGKPHTSESFIGIEGSFRKLNVD